MSCTCETGSRDTYLGLGDGLLRRLCEFLDGLGVVPQVLLAADQDDRKSMAEMKNLRDPLYRMN